MDALCDARVQRLATPKECGIFERNAADRGRDDLARQARQRWIELSAATQTDKEEGDDPLRRALWEALAAYEYLLGRSATGTRQTIRRRGLVRAAEHFATQGDLPLTLAELDQAGLLGYAWEQAVSHHPHAFSAQAVELSEARIAAYEETLTEVE